MIRCITILGFIISLGLQGLHAQEKLNVISSASMIWDMVNNIAGDHIESGLIVPIGGDPHLHEPTPADARKVAEADLIFINGLTFEGWITELIENSGTTAKVITVTEGINPISSTVYKNAYDPHAWMDVSLSQTYINNILSGLKELDPGNTVHYELNYRRYSKELLDLDQYIMKRIQEIPESKRLLITSHDAFNYYGRRYGIRVEGIIGISTESEAQTSDMLRVVDAIKESGVPAIFVESTINPKLIQQIAIDNNVVIGGSLYADSIGEKTSDGNSYIAMLRSNTNIIVDALAKNIITTSHHSQTNSQISWLAYGLLALGMLLGLLLFIWKMSN